MRKLLFLVQSTLQTTRNTLNASNYTLNLYFFFLLDPLTSVCVYVYVSVHIIKKLINLCLKQKQGSHNLIETDISIHLKMNVFNSEHCLDKKAGCVAHGLLDATSQAQTGFHTFLRGVDKTRGCAGMGDGGCLPHLEWDPLVLPGLTEGMGEEKHIIYSNSQSQKGKHLWHTHPQT